MDLNRLGVLIVGAVMLLGLFRFINGEREKEGKKPLGCLAIIIITALVITFWSL
tara:strand:+ start:250 stop:411 length:162 start_codon:yes stop_codon:yes gene_type:complete